jgi:hypothetical protein
VHMTGSSTSPSNYHLVDTPYSVTLANDSLSKVARSCNTHPSPDIGKIIKAFNCYDSFYPFLCVFQVLKTRRMIGMGHKVGGLYYLDLAPTSPSCALQSTP